MISLILLLIIFSTWHRGRRARFKGSATANSNNLFVWLSVVIQTFWYADWSGSLSNPERERHPGQRQTVATKSCIGNGTALSAMLFEACMFKRDALKCFRVRLLQLRREDSSRVPIGAAGTWRSDWRMRDVGVLIGQSACRLLALAREAIMCMC